MAKAKQKLSKIIREIVQQEVEKTLTEIFGDRKKVNAQKAQSDMIEKFNEHEGVSYTKNASLNEALNATANDDGFRTMKTYDSQDARAGFASMQDSFGGGKPTVAQMVPNDMRGREVDPAVGKALTRDYTDLVKAMNKKKK